MKFFDPVFKLPKAPSFEVIIDGADGCAELAKYGAEAANQIAKNISQKVLKLIYDEVNFKDFILFAAKEGLISNEEAALCLTDLEQETPQKLLTLWVETESIATLSWWATASFEIGSGDFNVLRNYIIASIIRSTASLFLSRDVVEHRGFTASIEAIPHVGRVAPLIALAEEHPELTRMLWSYNACRRPFQKQETEGSDKTVEKFNQSRNSWLLEFIIDPRGTIVDTKKAARERLF